MTVNVDVVYIVSVPSPVRNAGNYISVVKVLLLLIGQFSEGMLISNNWKFWSNLNDDHFKVETKQDTLILPWARSSDFQMY